MEQLKLNQKTVKYLESYLVTNRDVLDRSEITELEHMIGEYKQKMTVERVVLQYCVQYQHDLCTDDNGWLDMVLQSTGLTEMELFNGFENIAQDFQFELQPEDKELQYFGLHTPGVIVDNRDDTTTWIHADGVTLEITKMELEGVSDHWVIRRGHVVLTLFMEDVEELLENMVENNNE